MLALKLVSALTAVHGVTALAFKGAVGELPIIAERSIGFCTGNPAMVYRAYSNDTYNTDHLYTRSLDEINNARPQYRRERDCCRMFAGPRMSDAVVVPFYRLWNKVHWDHFYTISTIERDSVLASGQFEDQGIIGYVMTEPGCASWPLFRLYRGEAFTTFDHFYTFDAAERDQAIASGKYQYEGIAAWVWPTCDIQPCTP